MDEETQTNDNEKKTNFSAQNVQIYSEYVRSKIEILDRYYNVNWFMPEYLNKLWFQQKNDIKLLSAWRNNLIRLYWLLEPHEKGLKNTEKNKIIDKEKFTNLDYLQDLTHTIFNLNSLKRLTSYGIDEKEPIKAYKAENYGFFK